MKKTNGKRANATLRSAYSADLPSPAEAGCAKAGAAAKAGSSLRSTRRMVSEKTIKGKSKASEYVSNLLELHKLQGALLHRLDKEV